MATAGDVLEHPVTREKIVIRKTARDTAGELFQAEFFLPSGGFVAAVLSSMRASGVHMAASELIHIQRLTGAVLIASFIVFAIGGILPIVGKQGNVRIFTLPVRQHLLAVAHNAAIWRWANVFMGAAAVILLAGLSMLTTLLELADERLYSRLGLIGWLVSAVMWLIFSAFRGVVTVNVAQTIAVPERSDTAPAFYELLAQWGFALFTISALLGSLALVAYGGALLQTELVPAWAGWATLLFSLVVLVQLLVTGDTLPAFHYVPPLLIGVLLLSYRGT